MQALMQLISFVLLLMRQHMHITSIISSEEESIFNADAQDYIKCNTDECKKIVLYIKNNLDVTIDPCDNIYQFACGGWVKDNPANMLHPIIRTTDVLEDTTTKQIKEILEEGPKPDDTNALQKAKKLYNMCMDVDELESVGINTLKRYVDDNGGWPMIMSIEEWQTKNLTWQQINNNFLNNEIKNGLYLIEVTIDDKDSNKHIILIHEPILYIREDLIAFEQELPEKETYMSYIQQVAQIFIDEKGTEIKNEILSQDILALVDFEIELAKLTTSREQRELVDQFYTLRTIEDLQKEYDDQNPIKSQIDWYQVLQKTLARGGITVERSEKIVVQAYKYFTNNNNNLVSLLDRTPTRTIVNYMQWSFLRSQLPYADSRMRSIIAQMEQEYLGQQQMNERWEVCVKRRNLKKAISYEYVKRYVQSGSKEDANIIIENIANVVHKQISASTWMDNDTKVASLEKLNNMRMLVSSPDWYSDEYIDNYYDKLTITSKYAESVLNLSKFTANKWLSLLRKPVDKNEWDSEPTDINGFYLPNNNAIIITAAILQDPIYNKNHPAFFNYATLGAIIGHEINHGFDNLGSQFDKNGNAVEWWTQESTNNYKQLTQCFIDQYNGYEITGMEPSENITYVNGVLSLGENIGDSAGMIATYNAYKDRKIRLKETDIRLPGLEEYSNDQLFFINYAQMMCESFTPKIAKMFAAHRYPSWETRIRGTLSNMPEFSTAFNCPTGARMNPDDKCVLWK